MCTPWHCLWCSSLPSAGLFWELRGGGVTPGQGMLLPIPPPCPMSCSCGADSSPSSSAPTPTPVEAVPPSSSRQCLDYRDPCCNNSWHFALKKPHLVHLGFCRSALFSAAVCLPVELCLALPGAFI